MKFSLHWHMKLPKPSMHTPPLWQGVLPSTLPLHSFLAGECKQNVHPNYCMFRKHKDMHASQETGVFS